MKPKERHLATLKRAYGRVHQMDPEQTICRFGANASYAELRAVVRAVTPGKQTAKNTADAMNKAVRAVSRVIRRSAR